MTHANLLAGARLLLVLTLWTAQGSAQGVRVWAVGDSVRVNPVTGRLLEDRPDIHKDYPSDDFRETNGVWNRARNTVSLHAGRNEFVAFQLVVETQGEADEVDAVLTELKHAEGSRLSGKYVQLFKEWYVEVRRPSTGYEKSSLGPAWYADALLPKRKANLRTGFPFSIPDLYNNIPGQTNHAIWVDIYVPFERAEAPPGKYLGNVEVKWKGGSQSVRVELMVWDFALPQESHLPGDVWNGSMRQMPLEEERLYYQLARQHRFLPLIYAYRPELSLEGTRVQIDWTEYDRRVSSYLDGTAFTKEHGYWGPGYGRPVHHLMLPFDIEKHGNKERAWPMALPAAGRTAEYEAVWKEVGRQVREHLDGNPEWRKVIKVSFLDGLDESYYEDAYEKMIYYGKLLHESMGRGWFKYRIDGGYSREAMERMAGEVDLWVCHTVAFDLPTVEYFRKKGVETWFYGPMIYEQKKNSGCGSNTFLDLDLNVNRAIGWVGWKYQAGWVEWEFDWNAYASWYEAENFKEPKRIYNGSGQLVYRGIVMGYREPIPSIRLKAQRRGLQDYEYFWLLAQKSGRPEADAFVNRIIYKSPFGPSAMLDTEIWKNNPEEWDRVRVEVGQRLAQ
ncbi:MAG: glycoside hydrolase domain-containing protein [Acidobacteriota bacterium]